MLRKVLTRNYLAQACLAGSQFTPISCDMNQVIAKRTFGGMLYCDTLEAQRSEQCTSTRLPVRKHGT